MFGVNAYVLTASGAADATGGPAPIATTAPASTAHRLNELLMPPPPLDPAPLLIRSIRALERAPSLPAPPVAERRSPRGNPVPGTSLAQSQALCQACGGATRTRARAPSSPDARAYGRRTRSQLPPTSSRRSANTVSVPVPQPIWSTR